MPPLLGTSRQQVSMLALVRDISTDRFSGGSALLVTAPRYPGSRGRTMQSLQRFGFGRRGRPSRRRAGCFSGLARPSSRPRLSASRPGRISPPIGSCVSLSRWPGSAGRSRSADRGPCRSSARSRCSRSPSRRRRLAVTFRRAAVGGYPCDIREGLTPASAASLRNTGRVTRLSRRARCSRSSRR